MSNIKLKMRGKRGLVPALVKRLDRAGSAHVAKAIWRSPQSITREITEIRPALVSGKDLRPSLIAGRIVNFVNLNPCP